LAILLALSTGILFGFLPALRTTQFDLLSLTKLRGSIGGSRLGTRTGKTLVCIQVSLSMLLLISAGLFGRTLINLQSAPIGYNPNGLLFVETDPSRNPPTFVRETLNILQTMPGVSAAAVSQWPLYNNALPKLPVCVRAHDAGENGMDIEPVSPRFFETWGVPLLSGRDFDLSQDAGSSAIVNDKFVKTFFANRNPIGQQIGLGKCPGSSKTIVGVVGDHMDRQRAEITPMVYVTYPFPRMAPTTFAVRTVGDARALVSAIRRLMQEKAATVDGDVMTGIAYVERGWRQERLLAAFLFFFGLLALLISCVGIYGLLAYSVTGRTGEIGIRMALGAQTPAVIRLVTRESVVPVAAGILLGTLTFFAGVRWIESILFGISKSDPFTIIPAGTTLLLTAGIASVIPARRASRIDPMRALRSD
jgi:predicted permease